MEYKVEITISDKVTDEQVTDIVSTAFEGGINYWCGQVKIKKGSIAEEEAKGKYMSDLIVLGATLVLLDDELGEKHELTLEKVLNGIKMHCNAKGVLPSQLMEDYDADDADNIVQYGLFNELMYS